MLLGTATKQFEILDEGVHDVVLAAIQDLGIVPSAFDGTERQKVRFIYLSNEKDSQTGEPILVIQSMTNSLHEKATLRKTIKGILGKDPGDKPLADEKLVGTQCQIVVEHTESNGRTYANVVTTMPQRNGTKVEIPEGWEPPKVKTLGANDGPVVATAATVGLKNTAAVVKTAVGAKTVSAMATKAAATTA